jgi:hypothetical protein
MREQHTCITCGSTDTVAGLRLENVPAHAVRLHKTKATALNEPLGELRLIGCRSCGFVFNVSYDPTLHSYDGSYESTQSFSQTFNVFNRKLALSILNATVADGPIVEIGCGNGELLALFLELGSRDVVGFDPTFLLEHAAFTQTDKALIHAKNFDLNTLTEPPGAIVSKMTLEHVVDPQTFLSDIACAVPHGQETKIFIQVPSAEHVFDTRSIGDLLYEHCNYFSAQSLDRAFALAGLETVELVRGFGGQYLLAVAKVAHNYNTPRPRAADDELQSFLNFSQEVEANARLWRDWITGLANKGRRIAFWGGASKAVGFLSVTGTSSYFDCAIDINPRKAGSFLPASEIEIIAPDTAGQLNITDIIVCNPIYMSEVEEVARCVGISAKLHPMKSKPPNGTVSGK